MGTSIEMIILEKTDGVPFHQLLLEKQGAIAKENIEKEEKGEYQHPLEIFSAGNHFELMDFFSKSLENLADSLVYDSDELYYYIDRHNVESVLASTKKEIDRLFESADRYNPDMYVPYSTLGRLAQFHDAVKKTAEEKGFEHYYLIVDIG